MPSRFAFTRIVRAGQRGDSFCLLLEGSASVKADGRRAVTISNLFDMKTVEATTFAATVEALTVGVVLADEDSNIVHSNAAATADEPARITSGFCATASFASDSVRSALADA